MFFYQFANPLRRSIHFLEYFKRARKSPPVQWVFKKNTKILSLSPHSDDDVIGWGGWLHTNCIHGNSVVSVCLTDGSKGGGKIYTDRLTLARLREKEAERAAEIIGISEILFWGEPDGELKSSNFLVDKLCHLIADYQPDVVVLPSFLDAHPDHQATAEILAGSLRVYPQKNLICLQGEIWTPLPYWNHYVSIDSVLQVKMQAIKLFETQVTQANFLEASLGLSRYRSVFAQSKGRFIECFLATNAKRYVGLRNSLTLKKLN